MPVQTKVFSVSELSKISGVSVRTLHYYDQIGLLVPTRSKINDYRMYSKRDGVLLQQILVYRSMDMSLEKIKSIVLAENFDLHQALNAQHKLLLSKQAETQTAIEKIEATMSVLNGENNLTILFEGLPEQKIQQFVETIKQEESSDEVLQLYGKISADDMLKDKVIVDKWTQDYIKHMQLPVSDISVQNLIKDAYIIMNRMFFNTLENHKGVNYALLLKIIDEGRADDLTVEIYETYQQGLAKHYFDGLAYFAEHTLRNNEGGYVNLR